MKNQGENKNRSNTFDFHQMDGFSEWMDGWMDSLDGWMDRFSGWLAGLLAGGREGRMDGVTGWMDCWLAGWMDGWMVGWMDGWMDGWMGRALPRNFRKKKFGKINVSGSSLSKHPVGFSNAAGVHGALYGAWWCDLPGGVHG